MSLMQYKEQNGQEYQGDQAQQLIFDQMTSKKLKDLPNHKSWPASQSKINQELINKVNPQFDLLSSKKNTLPFTKRSQTRFFSPEAFKDVFLTTISSNFQHSFPKFNSLCFNWVNGQWKEIRMNLQSRLTKISYLEPTFAFQSFSTIEEEIKVEWRKNYLLKGLIYIWTHVFKTETFKNLTETKDLYNSFCNTFVVLSYSLFKRCFKCLVQKGIEVKMKLLRQTAISVVTQLKQWQQIYISKIYGYLSNHLTSFSENFNVQAIQANPKILNVYSKKEIFKNTRKSLSALINSLTLDEITQNLKQFRNNLVEQIGQSIESESSGIKTCKSITVQKQDLLGCIIYTLVRYKLDSIGVVLQYLSFLLGKDMDKVLNWRRVDCFKTDLEAAYWYVTQPVVEINTSCENVLNQLVF